ncbi:DUF2771 family protein [Gordonia sp. CPCC 205515]|uniref:DUF2771 family protein n=1 Tax=Gordonia sp. CPCC 205515 TaxID=3140791 RepID=UPI003AF334D4
MHLNSGEKKTLAIIAAIVVAFVVVVGATVAVLTKDTWSGDGHDDEGYLQLAIGDDLVRVEPAKWCDVLVRECDPPGAELRPSPHEPIPAGESALMSVSQEIAESPWVLYLMYADRNGKIINPEPEGIAQRSDSTYTQVLRSTPDRVLINVEVQPLSAVTEGDDYVARGILSVNTTPEGFTVRTTD